MQLIMYTLVMAASIGSIIAPFVIIRSLSTQSRIKYYILGAVGIACFIMPPVAIYFIFAVIMPAYMMHLMHRRMPEGSVSWRPVVLSPLPACVMLLAVLYIFASNAEPYMSTVIEYLYEYNQILNNTIDKELLQETFMTAIKLSPAVLYASIAIVFYFTERFYYRTSVRNIFPMPDFFLAVLLMSVILLTVPYITDTGHDDVLNTIGMNALICVAALYFFRGLDIVRYFFARFGFSPFVVGILYFMILISQPVMAIIALLGFISVYKNFIRDEDDRH